MCHDLPVGANVSSIWRTICSGPSPVFALMLRSKLVARYRYWPSGSSSAVRRTGVALVERSLTLPTLTSVNAPASATVPGFTAASNSAPYPLPTLPFFSGSNTASSTYDCATSRTALPVAGAMGRVDPALCTSALPTLSTDVLTSSTLGGLTLVGSVLSCLPPPPPHAASTSASAQAPAPALNDRKENGTAPIISFARR